MATRASKTLRVDILGDAERLRRELRQAEEDLGRLGREADDAGQDVRGLQGIIDRFDLGALAGAAGGLAVVETLDDAQVSAGRLRAQLGLTAGQAEEFEDVARRVYADNFGDTMGEAAQVTGIVHQALGDLRGDALQGAVEDIFRISDAFDHVGADTQILTDDVRVLKATWPGEDEQDILDRIAASFQAGTGNAGDLQDTLQEYPGLFADLGLDAGDMFAILDAGMEAGARNTDQVADAVKELGIRVQTAGDTGQEALQEMFPPDEAERLIQAFSEGGEAGRDAFFTVAEQLADTSDVQDQYNLAVDLFGTKAEDLGPALVPMLEGFAAARDRTGEVKDATGLLDQQYTGFRAQIEQVKRSIEVNLVGPLGGIVDVGGGVIQGAADVGVALLGLKGAGVDLSGMFGRLRTAGAGLTGTLGRLAGPIGLGGLGVALGLGAAALGVWAERKAEATALAQQFQSAIEADSGALGDNTRALVANQLEQDGLLEIAEQLGLSLPDVVDAVIEGGTAYDQMSAAAAAAAREQTGRFGPSTYEAARRVFELREGVTNLRDSMNDQLESSRRVADSIGDVADETDTATEAGEGWEEALRNANAALGDQESQADRVTDALEELSGVTITAEKASIRWEEALDDATDAVKDNKRTLDIHTEAGRANRRALLDLVDAGQDLIVNQAEQGRSNRELRGKVREVRDAFIDQAVQMGATRQEARRLARRYGLIPDEVVTEISAPGMSRVLEGAQAYEDLLKRLPDNVEIRWGGPQADGFGLGPVVGPASGWAAQWAAVSGAGFDLTLASGYRPGAVTSTGNRSYHALGRAIDIAGSADQMSAAFEWIKAVYGPVTKELIYTPKGSRQVHNGQDHLFSGGTIRQDHYDHVHWALERGGYFARRDGRPWVGQVVAAERHPEVMAPEPMLRQVVREEAGGRGPVTFAPTIKLFIGDREFTDLVRVEVERSADARSRDLVVLAGHGAV